MALLSPSYDRLENGMGAKRQGKKRFGWKKFAVGAVVLIGLVWLFGPREPRSLGWGAKEKTGAASGIDEVSVSLPSYPRPTHPADLPTVDHSLEDVPARPPSVTYESDPDHSKTIYCDTSFRPTSPLVQYALMIDAGSTGSRIHVYKFNNCGQSPTYEYEVFKMTQPGLSSFSGQPLAAAKSLDVLMDEALRVVPKSLQKCTPVAVKATAGLRLLGAKQSAGILAAVRERLHQHYPFTLPEQDGVVIMDGKDEGVYAWITANYLLHTIRPDTPVNTTSYAVLDLGGASTQIVFEPTFGKPDTSLAEGEHKYDLLFGGKNHVLYQHSYLGYGLMRARKSVHRLVDFMASIRKGGNETSIGNPCLAQNTSRVVEVEDENSGAKRNVTMVGSDVGSFEACNRVVQLVMAKDAICEMKPCSFDGVYQPSLMETFPTGKILLLSYFYDRLHPLLHAQSLQDQQHTTIAALSGIATDVCSGRSAWQKRWGGDLELMEELEGRPEWCLDLTFMFGLLRLGYEFGDEREVVLGKKIEGTELGWCLGATIAMVGGELTCRV